MIGMSEAWLLPVIPAGAFVALVLLGNYLPRKGDWIAVLAIFASFVLFFPIVKDLADALAAPGGFEGLANGITWLEIPGGIFELRLGVFVDQLAVVMLGVVIFVSFMVQVYSLGYMKGDRRYGWYYASMSLFAAAMITLVLADNFLLLYFAWELVGLCSYLLIGHYSERRSAAEAAKKAFITTRLGDVGLLIGILLLWRQTGTFDMQTTFEMARNGEIPQVWLTASTVLIFLGAMGKSAQFPFHVWLPDAMEGPTPVSALIHAATMVVAGVYLVARTLPLFELADGATELVVAVGLLTTFLSATMALVMSDIKRIIAYSTINSLGLMMVALGVGAPAAAMLYLFAHGFFKALLFLASGSVYRATDQLEVERLGGLWRKMPFTAVTFGVGVLAMAGMIPLSGFWAKDEILVGSLDWGGYVVLTLLLLSLPITALYMARLFILTFLGHPRDEHAFKDAHEAPASMGLPLLLLAVLTVVAGFVVFDQVGRAMGFPGGIGEFVFLEVPEAFHFDVSVAIGSAALVLLGLVGGWYLWRGEAEPARRAGELAPAAYRTLRNKYYMDDFYQAIIDRGVLAFSALVAWFDRKIVNDTGVDGAARSTGLSGYLLKFSQTGLMPNYALAITAGVVVLAIIALVIGV